MQYGFGWIPDVPDIRDHVFQGPPGLAPAQLPDDVDLRTNSWSDPYDQLKTNSCTGHAVGFLFESVHERQLQSHFEPSPAFIYWNARKLEDATNIDKGAYIRDAMRCLSILGTCENELWPLANGVLKEPTPNCYEQGRDHKAGQYARVERRLDALRACLFAGRPFVFGFSVYDSIDSARDTGEIPMPHAGEERVGAHAVTAVGYSHRARRFIIRNSWGRWGRGGYGTIPYEYLLEPNLADDFWTLVDVTG